MTTVLVFALRASLSVILVISAMAKLVDVPGFERTLALLRLPGARRASRHLAIALPSLELALGELVILGVFQPFVEIAVAILFVAFTCLTVWAVLTRAKVPCRCFGALTDSAFTVPGIIRGSGFSAAAFVVCLWSLSGNAIDWPASDRWLAAVGLLALGAAAGQAARTLSEIKTPTPAVQR
ncbi:MAG: MauE/DoxX family redox-associated membrane protein [Candidatus Dormibacteraceae bacterium]